ncbi:MAG: hypothetical protein CMI23_09450 [Opitutae bacterium]|nr:hypothetical protein [Opitutae bacterium]
MSVRDGFVSQLITEDDKTVALSTQNIDKTLKYVDHLKDMPVGKNMRHVAEVPLVIWEKAVQEGWSKDQNAWKKWLNDPDNKVFRTWQGKL